MNWKWPWVSRLALEIREQQVIELKAECVRLQAKYDDLDNQFTYRATGVAKDPDKLPEAFRRKVSVVDSAEKSAENPRINPNVRDRIKAAEEENQRQYDQYIHAVKPITGATASEAK